MTERQIPTMTELSEWGRTVATAYYEAGYVAGYARGREAENESIAALQRHAAATVRAVAKAGPYADLAERRGEPERAERQRAILAERGIA